MSDPLTTPPLPIEETPEILSEPEHVVPPAAAAAQALPPVGMLPKKKSGSFARTLGLVILFLGLFVVGIWLSSFLRQFLTSDTGSSPQSATSQTGSPTPTKSAASSIPSDLYASWNTYEVVSGVTKKPLGGVSYKLPPDVLSPVCDGSGCSSQGTYLPGGTRFTIAPRGAGQTLRDFRGSVISDVNGKAFETKEMRVAGLPAVEFSGSFAGRTISGYVFSKMRGVMIALSDTTSLEINHFTPNGIASDFEADEVLFDSILKTISAPLGTEKGAVLATPTIAIASSSSKPATSSGY